MPAGGANRLANRLASKVSDVMELGSQAPSESGPENPRKAVGRHW